MHNCDHSWHRFRSRHNRSAARHQHDTPCPHPRCLGTLHHKRTPDLRAFLRYPPQAPMPYQFILVLFRRSRRTSEPAAMSEQSLGLSWVSRTPYCLKDSLDNDFEDIPLTEPDDIRPEPDGKVAICPAMKNWRPCSVKMTRPSRCRL